jgi:hypothetical protein
MDNTIPIRRSTIDAIAGYLSRCPFADVERLIVALRQDVQAAQVPPPEPVEEPK